MTTQPPTTRVFRQLAVLLTLLAGVLLPGCSTEEVARLEDYLEELEFDRPLESVKEIKINGDYSYRISCAAQHHDESGADTPPLWVQMKFDLYVIAAEEDEEAVLKSIERYRGLLDDTVLSVCRESSIDQLQDNRWATLKTRLLEAIRPILGTERIRQVTLVYSHAWEPI